MSQKKKTCNHDQANHLQSRLISANRNHSDHVYEFRLIATNAVKQARRKIIQLHKIISAHDHKERRIKEGMQTRLRKAEKDVRQVILFGTPEEAIKAVENFENFMF